MRPIPGIAIATARGVRIRMARPADARRIGAFGPASWLAGIGVHVDPAVRARIDAATFADFVRQSWRRILVAERGGIVVGIAAVEFGDNYISDLWVAPEAEGRGIGSLLLAAIEAQIAARGHRSAEIEVATANRRALRLYRRRGYAVVRQFREFDRVLRVVMRNTRLRKALRGAPPIAISRSRRS